MTEAIDRCRICGGRDLERVLDLGAQALTGVFPKHRDDPITRGPLRLVKCVGGNESCGLLQLEHTFNLREMYGDNYGYRSGLNSTMVRHLRAKVEKIEQQVDLKPGDLVVDVGSNDGTTLRAYQCADLLRVGIDPAGEKFRQYYPAEVTLISDFFSSALVRSRYGRQQAKVVTSIAMFYDLPAPMEIMSQIWDILADDGLWVLEQSYMPRMMEINAYDTVCHEHLEFYSLSQIQWMAERVGFHIVDVEFNDVNGGSFSVTARKTSRREPLAPIVAKILEREVADGLGGLAPFRAFAQRVSSSRAELRHFLDGTRDRGDTVAALGASTKGNVLLQYCGVTEEEVFAVGEVNSDKFGCFTPGTGIPIMPEAELIARNPDYLIVLPWHFRSFFEGLPSLAGRDLVFPLPELFIRRGS